MAYGIKDIVDAYRANNPDLKYIVAVGNDDVIPFFRYPDQALLANESGYVPPVLDTTASQAQLQNGYLLGQDTYGYRSKSIVAIRVSGAERLAVGRLVETAGEINAAIDAFLATNGTIPAPDEALVTGYDFLADAANAIEADLLSGLGPKRFCHDIGRSRNVAPVNGWNAGICGRCCWMNRPITILSTSPDTSAHSARSPLTINRGCWRPELLESAVDFTNAIVFSNGCHSGYNSSVTTPFRA